MRGQQTYTLTTILNTNQIRPQLYQQILHDLKSPLEQVSIDLTHDNSFDTGPPRRPNITPPPPKSPLNQLRDCSFSRTHESLSLSRQSPQREHFHDDVIESVVSPLDQQISFKEEPNGAALFCGALMESILANENSYELQLPPRSRSYKRRPIFPGKQASRLARSPAEVIAILQQMGEPQMAVFMGLLRDLEGELGRVSQEREEARRHLEAILDKLSGGIEFLGEEQEDSPATYRILRRLRSKNTYELVAKLAREDSPNRTTEADRRLQALLQSLGRLEAIISRFMSGREALEVLETVYEGLQEGYPSEPTLLGQISRLCESLGCTLDLRGLQFVWREGDRRRLSREEFLEGVAMNDCVVRLPRSFEEELQEKGFTRNQ